MIQGSRFKIESSSTNDLPWIQPIAPRYSTSPISGLGLANLKTKDSISLSPGRSKTVRPGVVLGDG